MTVKELIDFLQTCPQDAVVLYRCCSDYSVLDDSGITIQSSGSVLDSGSAVLHHNMPGNYRMYSGPWEYKDMLLPTPADAVILPGN